MSHSIVPYIYRNHLLKKYMMIGLTASVFLTPVYYVIDVLSIAVALMIFALGTMYLWLRTNQSGKYVTNSRAFMALVTMLFLTAFLDGNQTINSNYFLLLYPVASFSLRGPREGILLSVAFQTTLVGLYIGFGLDYQVYSYFFFNVAFVMVAFLLYYYRFYEMKTFISINEQLEQTVAMRTAELEESNKQLETLATTDKLTGIYNRSKLDELLQTEINRCQRFNHHFGLSLMDLDYFKKINDSYGHQVGDQVLKEVAQLLTQHLRKTDLVGRWGGRRIFDYLPGNQNGWLRKTD